MKITTTKNWNRRDFTFDMKCESCGKIEKEIRGYDDSNFYNNVIPKVECKACGKTSKDYNNDNPDVPESNIVPRHDPNQIM